jgi:hypothetical protein
MTIQISPSINWVSYDNTDIPLDTFKEGDICIGIGDPIYRGGYL